MFDTLELQINGASRSVKCDPDKSLLWVLRDDLDLTGSKYGCGEGQCGACTVLIDGVATRSCVTKVSSASGKRILTIEGLEKNGRLHPVQQAFLDAGQMQCGYCTAGMIMSATALLQKNANPNDQQILRAMEGNVCRCGTYTRIVQAIKKAARNGGGEGK